MLIFAWPLLLLLFQVQEQAAFVTDQGKVQGYIQQRKEVVERVTVHPLPPAKGDQVRWLV